MIESLIPLLTFSLTSSGRSGLSPFLGQGNTLPKRDQEASKMQEAEIPVKLLCNGKHQFF